MKARRGRVLDGTERFNCRLGSVFFEFQKLRFRGVFVLGIKFVNNKSFIPYRTLENTFSSEDSNYQFITESARSNYPDNAIFSPFS